MSDSAITFLILGAVVVLFVSNRTPVAIIAMGTALSLWATGVLDLDQATAGIGDPELGVSAARTSSTPGRPPRPARWITRSRWCRPGCR